MDTPTKPLRTAPGGIIRKAAFVPVINRAIPFALTKGQTVYFNVGGTIKSGETPEQAVVRECMEEAGIEIDPRTLRFLELLKEDQCFGFVPGTKFEMYLFDGTFKGDMRPCGEVEKIRLFTTANKHETTPMGGRILDSFKAKKLID